MLDERAKSVALLGLEETFLLLTCQPLFECTTCKMFPARIHEWVSSFEAVSQSSAAGWPDGEEGFGQCRGACQSPTGCETMG